MRRQWKFDRGTTVFYLAAILMLFWALGVNPLWASEDRWAEIARNMWLTGDWFHPAINGVVYFDKPLLSYWPIALLARCCGFIHEFLVRLPSALAALAALWATRDLARRTAGAKAGNYAGWLLLSSYGFLFWGRTAAADMLNLAAVVLAVDWFIRKRDTAGFGSYFLFYLICFAGALAKGLPALILPPVVVSLRVCPDGTWRRHLVWRHFLAVPPALLLALSSFIAAALLPMPDWYLQPEHGLSGLELVWRENVLRVFRPFDHDDEGWYAYFIHLPRILAPWSPAVAGALAAAVASWRKQSREMRWLWLGALAIFALFSLSGSRRWYYILPIMPFMIIPTAQWMADNGRWSDWGRRFYWWSGVFAGLAAALGAAGTAVWFAVRGNPAFIGQWIGPGTLILLVALLLALPAVLGKYRNWQGVLWAVSLCMAAVFSVLLPEIGRHRTEKPFALALKQDLRGVTADRMVFFLKEAPKVVYYMELARPIRTAKSEEELQRYLLRHRGETIYIIADNRPRTLTRLGKVIPPATVDQPWRKESILEPFEKAKARKLYCWRYPVPRQ